VQAKVAAQRKQLEKQLLLLMMLRLILLVPTTLGRAMIASKAGDFKFLTL